MFALWSDSCAACSINVGRAVYSGQCIVWILQDFQPFLSKNDNFWHLNWHYFSLWNLFVIGFRVKKTAHKLIHDVKIHIFVNRFAATFKPIMQLWSYYPVVPAVVGTTSSSDMTGCEASGGCHWQDGPSCFYASVISCNVNVTQPNIFFSTEWHQQTDIHRVILTLWH